MVLIFVIFAFLIRNALSIIGGGPAPEEISYHAAIFHQTSPTSQPVFKGNGALIAPGVVVTASTCVSNPNNETHFLVRLRNNSLESKVTRVEFLKPETMIALLHLEHHFDDPDTLIPLVEYRLKSQLTKGCIVSGLGSISNSSKEFPAQLHSTELTIYDNVQCSKDILKDPKKLCAGFKHRGTCSGDLGAPLVCHDALVGIALNVTGCGRKGQHTVFANVFEMRRAILGQPEPEEFSAEEDANEPSKASIPGPAIFLPAMFICVLRKQ